MCLSYYNSNMQGKHGSFITDLIILIKAPTNHVVEGKLNWVHSELRCMGASNQKSFSWFKSVSGRCSSFDCSLSSAMQNVVFVRHTELEGLGINEISWHCPGSWTCITFWHLLWKGWFILTYGHSLYTTVNNIGWQSSFSFLLGLAIAWWLTLRTWPLFYSSILLVLHPSESLSYSIQLQSCSILLSPWHVKLQGCPLALISLFTSHCNHGSSRVQTKTSICLNPLVFCPIWVPGYPAQWLFRDITKSKNKHFLLFLCILGWLIHLFPTHILERGTIKRECWETFLTTFFP